MVSTEYGFNRGLRWTETCPKAAANTYTNDFGTGRRIFFHDCLIVTSAFAPADLFSADSQVMKAVADQGLTLFKEGYAVRSVYGATNGTYLRVQLLTQKNFAGMAGAAPASRPLYEVPPELVAWGEAVHAAVRHSVLSLGGQLAIPAVEFKE